MNRVFSLSIAFALVAFSHASGQTGAQIPPPEPPYVAPMPDNTESIVTVTTDDSVNLPPHAVKLVQMINTRSATSRRLLTLFSDGSQYEIWFVDGYRLEQVPGGKWVLATRLSRKGDIQDTDFPDLQWINRSNYVAPSFKDSTECYEFKSQLVERVQRVTLGYDAYIDVKTKRPVEWQVGPYHFEISSVAPITTMPEMPPAYAEKLKLYQTALQKNQRSSL